MATAETQRTITIARQYYLEGLSKVEIAKLHDLSRFKVARILEEALETGLVRIEIADAGLNDTELAEQLRQRYELHHAAVVTGPFGDRTELRSTLGEAADYMVEGSAAVLQMYDVEIVGVDLPAAVELNIAETEPGIQGDRVSGARKPATLETGLVVQVPLFIEPGETVKVDTRSGEYLARA